MLSVVVLASGRGSNLIAIDQACRRGDLPARIRAVVSNNPDAPVLSYASRQGIDHICLDHRRYPSREAFDQALQQHIDRYAPGLVVLAGFMRILSPPFIRHYKDKLINIHPSLLPRFPGLNTHARALAAGVHEHGASVHFVTEKVDQGPVIVQAVVPVYADDTAETLARRTLEREHLIFPLAIKWFAQRRLRRHDGQWYLDGQPLTAPRRIPFEQTVDLKND